MPTQPDETTNTLWRQLRSALSFINHAQWEYQRGNVEAGDMWLGDSRRALGVAALTLSDVPSARLLEAVLTEPNATDAARAARGGIDVPTTE